MKSQIDFIFSAGSINDQFMNIAVNGNPIEVRESFTASIEVELPTTIEIQVSGKSPSDTIVKNNVIIADKYIKLDSIYIDGFKVESWQIPEKYLILTTINNEVLSTDYWGKNGKVQFIIDQDDPALWLLECPKVI